VDVQAQDPGSIPGRVARQTRGEDNHIPSVAEPAAAVAVAATSLRALALATAYKDIIVTLPPPRLESIPL
jgi:hypothetical protein